MNPPFAGIYVCGPTVYGPPHLGHARAAITFDILFRYLKHCEYKVRYVRNITDVGHLENDADEGEDKILKKAKLDQLEPMEVVQLYLDQYHKCMDKLNVLRPSIEPRATGHIPEQISAIEKIIEKGYGYVVNGSVYFDVIKYNKNGNYGILSGRKIEDLISGQGIRELEGQQEKKNNFDFALWKKATPEHLMHWQSPWGEGFPGWHIECSVMSKKYLGEVFDIHGGGMDLLFPHHECEMAQSFVTSGFHSVKYWMHNNMVTLNGQKMGKSLGNAIGLEEFFSGKHPLLERAYSPMTVRFFMLQAHYRSTLDFSNAALQASEKGLKKLLNAIQTLTHLTPNSDTNSSDISKLQHTCYEVMNDDLNTAQLISQLFEGVRIIHAVNEKSEKINAEGLQTLKTIFKIFFVEILGLEMEEEDTNERFNQLINFLIEIRNQSRATKDFATSDLIRKRLTEMGIVLEDTKDGTRWVRG